MPTTPLSLQPLTGLPYTVVSGWMFMPYVGAWIVDCVLDSDSLSQNGGVPSGKVVLTFGGVRMSGTIDPRHSGSFGPGARVRVVAGAGAWDSTVQRQTWNADNGVLSTEIYSQTATLVGEVVADLNPTFFGTLWERPTGQASEVFLDNPWFVDVTGVTNVGPRPPAIQDTSLVIRDWDAVRQEVSFSCATILYPNTTLVDARFGTGPGPTIYDVEQTFDANGSSGIGRSATSPGTVLVENLKSATLAWTRAPWLRTYRYRLIGTMGPGPGGGPNRLALQAVNPSAGMPDIVPIAPFSGLAGAVAELAPSQEVLVAFENADPTLPHVVAWSLLGLPLSSTIDAQTEIKLGPTVLAVQIAGGGDFLVQLTQYDAMITALTTFANALSLLTTAPLTPVGAAGATLLASLQALLPAGTTKTKAS